MQKINLCINRKEEVHKGIWLDLFKLLIFFNHTHCINTAEMYKNCDTPCRQIRKNFVQNVTYSAVQRRLDIPCAFQEEENGDRANDLRKEGLTF